MTLHSAMANELKSLGGILRCSECGQEESLEGMSRYLAHGWPTCCKGYAMTWVTQRLLAEDAYAVFHPAEPREMTHDFRGGFHLGFQRGSA